MVLQTALIKNVRYNKHQVILFLISLVVLIGIFTIDLAVQRNVVEAGVSHNISGYAWSETVGWISFNCTDTSSCGTADYGVGVTESNGNLFGYAWSPNIGWITFNKDELSGCPRAPCRAKLSSGALTGWAHVLSSLDPESGGWDGWISLSGDNYGVTLSGTDFSGYAWGSAIVGWIDFNPQYGGVVKNVLTASLSASESSVVGGQSVTLTWTSTLAAECSGTNFSTGGATSGSVVEIPNSTTNYTLTCSNDFDSINDTEQVQVSGTECTDGVDNDLDGEIDLDDLGCTNPADDNESSVEFVTMLISARPGRVQIGNTTVIAWRAEDVEAGSCTVSGTNGDSWVGNSGSQETRVISEQVVYTLTCLDIEGDPSSPEQVTVSLVPIFQEF